MKLESWRGLSCGRKNAIMEACRRAYGLSLERRTNERGWEGRDRWRYHEVSLSEYGIVSLGTHEEWIDERGRRCVSYRVGKHYLLRASFDDHLLLYMIHRGGERDYIGTNYPLKEAVNGITADALWLTDGQHEASRQIEGALGKQEYYAAMEERMKDSILLNVGVIEKVCFEAYKNARNGTVNEHSGYYCCVTSTISGIDVDICSGHDIEEQDRWKNRMLLYYVKICNAVNFVEELGISSNSDDMEWESGKCGFLSEKEWRDVIAAAEEEYILGSWNTEEREKMARQIRVALGRPVNWRRRR